MKEKTKYRISFSIFLGSTIILLMSGIIGIVYSTNKMNELINLDKNGKSYSGKVVSITKRNRSSENSYRIKIIENNELVNYSIGKLLINLNENEAVSIIKDVKTNQYFVIEFIKPLMITNILRILIFIVLLFLSFIFGIGTKDIYKNKKKCLTTAST